MDAPRVESAATCRVETGDGRLFRGGELEQLAARRPEMGKRSRHRFWELFWGMNLHGGRGRATGKDKSAACRLSGGWDPGFSEAFPPGSTRDRISSFS